MPIVGEIRKAVDIGYKGSSKYTWIKCPQCNKERWVQIYKGEAKNQLCADCTRYQFPIVSGFMHPHWSGGRTKHSDGYIQVVITPDNPFYAMGYMKGGTTTYIFEHRLVMAKHLGRCLQEGEIVHHKNGIKDDNRIDNLALSTQSEHLSEHMLGYKAGYNQGFRDALKLKKNKENSENITYITR